MKGLFGNRGFVILRALVLFLLTAARCANATDESQASIPAEWTQVERAVWEKIRTGEVANLTSSSLSPGNDIPQAWEDQQRISASFLQTILLDPKFVQQIPHSGVRIQSAWISQPINLAYADMPFEVSLKQCRFDGEVSWYGGSFFKAVSFYGSEFRKGLDLGAVRIANQLNLGACRITGTANLELVNIGNLLLLTNAPHVDVLNLRGAHIGYQAALFGLSSDSINMDGTSVGGMLLINGCDIGSIVLRGSKTGDMLAFQGSHFRDEISADGVAVGGSLLIEGSSDPNQKPDFKAIKLHGARIEGDLEIRDLALANDGGFITFDGLDLRGGLFVLSAKLYYPIVITGNIGGLCNFTNSEFGFLSVLGATIKGGLGIKGCRFLKAVNLAGISVVQDMTISDTTFEQAVDATFARIGSNLDLSGGEFDADLDLTGAKIEGYLSLGYGKLRCKWSSKSKLALTDTNVRSLQDRTDAWPSVLQLDGFSYSQWGVFQPFILLEDPRTTNVKRIDFGDFVSRDASWFAEWLSRQPNYSPQPYFQAAGVLRAVGMQEKANEILYAGKERERREARWLNALVLWLSKIFIGYGYHYERSVYWCLGFVILGTIVLNVSGEGRKHEIELGFFYSLNAFLPFVQLKKKFEDIDFAGWVTYYFYFHRLAGYIIGSFILAGLAGITK
jgi:hypothetical protein